MEVAQSHWRAYKVAQLYWHAYGSCSIALTCFGIWMEIASIVSEISSWSLYGVVFDAGDRGLICIRGSRLICSRGSHLSCNRGRSSIRNRGSHLSCNRGRSLLLQTCICAGVEYPGVLEFERLSRFGDGPLLAAVGLVPSLCLPSIFVTHH